jgi:hypothetical protein
MLSGCSLLLVAWGDLTTLDPVQSVDVLWAKRADYSEGQSIDFDETLSMPPMEAPPARISPTPSKRLGAALSTAWRRTAACHANTPS